MKKIWTSIMLLLAAMSVYGQEKAVSVSLNVPAAVMTVSKSTVSLSGHASAVAGIAKVTWQTSNGEKGLACGTSAWEVAIPVAPGTTAIIVKAYDANGASAWVEVVAVKAQPEL
ncbi:MAG TPA: hypothetical protein VHC90_15725 [Bryobacteraceae bacterium]|nr:hypothetical protein [Bryobacteraceae bacterium]